jgi:hypothetical protein
VRRLHVTTARSMKTRGLTPHCCARK